MAKICTKTLIILEIGKHRESLRCDWPQAYEEENPESQFFNEDKTLRDIYSERARRRQVEAGKLFGENHPKTQEVVLSYQHQLLYRRRQR